MPVNFFHGSKSPTENGWFTIRLVQAKQVNNHSIIQKLRSLGGWNRSHKNPQDSGPWWPWSTAWHSQRRSLILPAEFEALRIPVQNVFLQEKMAPKFPKGLPFFQQIRSTWVSPWPFWGLFPWLLLWCVSARGGPEFLEVRYHYVASCAINYPCIIENMQHPTLQKEFENQRTQSLGSTFPRRGRGKIPIHTPYRMICTYKFSYPAQSIS